MDGWFGVVEIVAASMRIFGSSDHRAVYNFTLAYIKLVQAQKSPRIMFIAAHCSFSWGPTGDCSLPVLDRWLQRWTRHLPMVRFMLRLFLRSSPDRRDVQLRLCCLNQVQWCDQEIRRNMTFAFIAEGTGEPAAFKRRPLHVNYTCMC